VIPVLGCVPSPAAIVGIVVAISVLLVTVPAIATPVVAVPPVVAVMIPIVLAVAVAIPVVGCVPSPAVIVAIAVAVVIPVVPIVVVMAVVAIVPPVAPPPMVVVAPVPPGRVEVDVRGHPALAAMPDRLLGLFLEDVLPYPVGHADLTLLDHAGRDPERSPLLTGARRRQRGEQAEQKRQKRGKGRLPWHDGAGPRSRAAPRP
jgi:hypothetical protein